MAERPQSNARSDHDHLQVAAPQLALPKGGGAIRGIGEKFAANPVTDTGTLAVPIAVSSGRSGFGPQLTLTYNSGSGNGPFGLGWSKSLPSITSRTDRGLPQYQDAVESDVFILSGAEDLVPALIQRAEGQWAREASQRNGYTITRCRPRIEGLFALIERWTSLSDPRDTFWRSISKDPFQRFWATLNSLTINRTRFLPGEVGDKMATPIIANPGGGPVFLGLVGGKPASTVLANLTAGPDLAGQFTSKSNSAGDISRYLAPKHMPRR